MSNKQLKEVIAKGAKTAGDAAKILKEIKR